MRSWRIIEDRNYSIQFDCAPSQGGFPTGPLPTDHGDYNVSAQVGHCHTGADSCSSINVYADETVRLTPRFTTQAPEFGDALGTWAWNYSLECCPSNPTDTDEPRVTAGTYSRICGFNSYHGDCFWRVGPSGSAQPTISYVINADPPSGGTSAQINEWVLRCPHSQNATDCVARVYVQGLNTSGSQTAIYSSGWTTVPKGPTWYLHWVKSSSFPSNTVKWKFAVQMQAGYTLDADFSQQAWRTPP